MRGFRSDRVNLSDTRIAYTLLIVIAVVCTIMGMVASRTDGRLRKYELDSCYNALAECADSLHAWLNAENEDDKLTSALRFRNAAVSLPAEIEIEPLLDLAKSLREEDERTAYNARAMAETFALLASFEYEDGKNASEMVASTLAGVENKVLIREKAPEEATVNAELSASTPDTTQYSLNIAEHVMASLFSDSGQVIPCKKSGDGSVWVAQAENIRMTFSSFDGELESFLYIRLGETPEASYGDDELIERLTRFAEGRLKMGNVTAIHKVGQLGGFAAMELTCKRGDYRAVMDRFGRVWSLAKVKR